MRQQKRNFIGHYGGDPDTNDVNIIRNIALKSAIKAATMHNRTYSNNVTTRQRNEFRNEWRRLITELGEKYLNTSQSVETYIQDVLTMKETINNQFGGILYNGGIRIGHCQKALSIYLKWRWCYNDIMPAPPMCAIDSNILNRCHIVGRYTMLDNEELFRQWVRSIIETARQECMNPINGLTCNTVAEWELVVFNHRNNQ